MISATNASSGFDLNRKIPAPFAFRVPGMPHLRLVFRQHSCTNRTLNEQAVMARLPLFHLPKPSKHSTTSLTSHALFNHPAARCPNDDIAALIALYESKRSLRTLLREDQISKISIPPPMAVADDLFHNRVFVPSLKLPPRLQAVASPRSPRIASSPKSPCRLRGFKGGKDFDPFMAAVERIRKEDASAKPFCWRQLEHSFEKSVGRVFDGELGGEFEWGGEVGETNGGSRRNNYYCRLEMKESRCCKNGRQGWKLLSCFLRKSKMIWEKS